MTQGGSDEGNVALREHFSRLVSAHRVDARRVSAFVRAIDDLSVEGKSAQLPLWEPLSQTELGQMLQFLLLPVQRYFAPSDSRSPRNCHIRRLNRQLCATWFRKFSATIRDGALTGSINGIELYIFSTGIVFMVVDLCLVREAGAIRIDELIEANYRFRVIESHHRVTLEFKARTTPMGGQGVSTQQVAFEDLLADVCRRAGGDDALKIFEIENLNERGLRIQTFVRVADEVALESFRTGIEHLRLTTKRSYITTDAEDVLTGALFHTFGNAMVGISQEGFVLAVVDSSHPFNGEFGSRFRTSYFLHYLLAVHQRVALLALSADAQSVLAVNTGDTDTSVARSIFRLRRRAIGMGFQHKFSTVSTISHYVRIYDELLEALAVPKLAAELRDKVVEMDEVARMHERLQNERRNQTLDQLRIDSEGRELARDRRLSRFVAIVGPMSLLLMLFATHFYKDGIHLDKPSGWGPVLAAGLLTLFLIGSLAGNRPAATAHSALSLSDGDDDV